MLRHETTEKMNTMKLFGMVSSFEAQLSSSEYKELSFEERCCSHRHHADFRAGLRRGPGLAAFWTAGPAREEPQR